MDLVNYVVKLGRKPVRGLLVRSRGDRTGQLEGANPKWHHRIARSCHPITGAMKCAGMP